MACNVTSVARIASPDRLKFINCGGKIDRGEHKSVLVTFMKSGFSQRYRAVDCRPITWKSRIVHLLLMVPETLLD